MRPLPALEVLDDLCLRSLTLPGPERRLLLRLYTLARRVQGGPLAGHAAALLAQVPEEAVILLATGAGAEMRVTLGIAVLSGMLGVTFFGLLFTPVFYATIRWLTSRRRPAGADRST